MDPVAKTVVIAEFCLVAPHDKTDHNVINNKACQQFNSEQISTTQAILYIKFTEGGHFNFKKMKHCRGGHCGTTSKNAMSNWGDIAMSKNETLQRGGSKKTSKMKML